MKAILSGLGLVVMAVMFVGPAYGVAGTAGVAPSEKTFSDFRKDFSATKPIVAWHRYQEYKMLQRAPRATLAPSSLRTVPGERSGTSSKPVLRMLKGR